MSRMSTDELAGNGSILNGFDYQLQVWVINGIIQKDGHRTAQRGCNGCAYAGASVVSIPGHERRG